MHSTSLALVDEDTLSTIIALLYRYNEPHNGLRMHQELHVDEAALTLWEGNGHTLRISLFKDVMKTYFTQLSP